MSDYTKTTNFTAKDALNTGDPNKVIKGSEHDTEFDNIATASATKSNKVVSPTTDNVIKQSASGDLTDAGYSFSGLSGDTAVTKAEVDILDGATLTTTELNYVDGVTSAIQTQIDNIPANTTVNMHAYLNANQACADSTETVIVFNTALVNTSTYYSTSNGKFTPLVAGWYQVDAFITLQATVDASFSIVIYKNDAEYLKLSRIANQEDHSRGALIEFNGSTDYITVKGDNSTGGSKSILGGSTPYVTSLSIHKVV